MSEDIAVWPGMTIRWCQCKHPQPVITNDPNDAWTVCRRCKRRCD